MQEVFRYRHIMLGFLKLQRTLAIFIAKGLPWQSIALFDGIEDGGIRASHEIDEHDNDRAMDGLQDKVIMLKKLTGDIHEKAESHNHMLDYMGNDMDSSRGILSGTMDKFKMVFETKSSQRTLTLVAALVIWRGKRYLDRNR